MKNKTLLFCLIAAIAVNIVFAISAALLLAMGKVQPFLALFITSLMFAYHIDIRLLSGLLITPFKKRIRIDKKCHQISKAEFARLDKIRVKRWKDRYPTLFKGQFALTNDNSIDEIIRNNINSERVHWACCVLGMGAIPLGCVFSSDELWIYLATSLLSSFLLDLPLVLIQRYNRHRLYALRNMLEKKQKTQPQR